MLRSSLYSTLSHPTFPPQAFYLPPPSPIRTPIIAPPTFKQRGRSLTHTDDEPIQKAEAGRSRETVGRSAWDSGKSQAAMPVAAFPTPSTAERKRGLQAPPIVQSAFEQWRLSSPSCYVTQPSNKAKEGKTSFPGTLREAVLKKRPLNGNYFIRHTYLHWCICYKWAIF